MLFKVIREKGLLWDKYSLVSSILLREETKDVFIPTEPWEFDTNSWNQSKYKYVGGLIIYGYGTARRMAPHSLSETDNQDATATLFSDEIVQELTSSYKTTGEQVWRQPYIKKALLEMSAEKCCYCETTIGEGRRVNI